MVTSVSSSISLSAKVVFTPNSENIYFAAESPWREPFFSPGKRMYDLRSFSKVSMAYQQLAAVQSFSIVQLRSSQRLGRMVIVSTSVHSASAPYSCIKFSVRSMQGREITLPNSFSSSPFSNVGPIISNAETYCELTLPATSTLPPFSFLPLMSNGGNPSSPVY